VEKRPHRWVVKKKNSGRGREEKEMFLKKTIRWKGKKGGGKGVKNQQRKRSLTFWSYEEKRKGGFLGEKKKEKREKEEEEIPEKFPDITKKT